MKPYYRQAILIFIFILGCMWFLFINDSMKKLNWVVYPILILLIFLFINSFYNVISPPSYEKTMSNKWYSEYSEEGFKTFSPSSQQYTYISWQSIEAIFLSNQTPRDGDYHNFRYTFILNKEPEIIKYENQNWFNRNIDRMLPNVKKSGLPIYSTDDYIQRDFNKISDAIEKYLEGSNKNLDNYLSKKFGNDVKQMNGQYKNTKPLKYFGFYKIFDRNNPLNDSVLNKFREETKNQKNE